MSIAKQTSLLLNYTRRMGIRWFLFRVKYAIYRKTGFFDRMNRNILYKKATLSLEELAIPENIINQEFNGNASLSSRADNAIAGKIFAFSHEYYDYAKGNGGINFHYNPISDSYSHDNIAWNQLPDFGSYGDIKNIWEASRFPQLYYFINAYSVTKNRRYADAGIAQITKWCADNPFPFGVNYKCGQEIAFRLFSWLIAMDYFRDFIGTDEKKIIFENIYVSLLRIDANIDYARKSVKNNHSISESAGLLIGGLLFHKFPESEYFICRGLKILRQEVAYQVFEDGGYIQHSFNYQRLALDIISFVIHVTRRKHFELPDDILKAHRKMLEFLYSFMQEDGLLPNYGSNDGACLFPVSTLDYRDFRPSLNLAAALTYGKYLFDEGMEPIHMFGLNPEAKLCLDKQNSFEQSGYYILKNESTFIFIRCHSYKTRPAQCDMLHTDIWHRGINYFCDSGTYSYNSKMNNITDFKSTVSHNTVKINDADQMEQVSSFGWANWIKAEKLKHSKNTFTGRHYGYRQRFGVCHIRKIEIDNIITITDTVEHGTQPVKYSQIWNTPFAVRQIDAFTFEAGDCRISSNTRATLEKAMISDYYNEFHSGTRLIFEASCPDSSAIITKIEFSR